MVVVFEFCNNGKCEDWKENYNNDMVIECKVYEGGCLCVGIFIVFGGG